MKTFMFKLFVSDRNTVTTYYTNSIMSKNDGALITFTDQFDERQSVDPADVMSIKTNIDKDYTYGVCNIGDNKMLVTGFTSYSDAYSHYLALGYKDYGWLNGGAKPPVLKYRTVYQNYSGSSTLEVNEEFGVMYSVDMGD